MKKILSLGIVLLFVVLNASFVVHAGSPPFVFYKSDEQPLIVDIEAGEESEIDFFVGNLDETRSITMQLSLKKLSDKAGETAIPLEWASFLPEDVWGLSPGENKPVLLVLDVPTNTEPGIYKISLRGTLTDYEGRFGGGVVMSSALGIILRVNVVNPGFVSEANVEFDKILDESDDGVTSFMLFALFFVSLLALIVVFVLLKKK